MILRLEKKNSLPISTKRPISPAAGCRLGLGQRQPFDAVDTHLHVSAVNVDTELDPLIRADVRARFVAPVWILLTQ
jgi:hypothetical protein